MGKSKARSIPARRWQASSPELIEGFAAAVKFIRDAESRKMFGYPAVFVNGRLFAGLFEERMVLKLPPQARSELLKFPGTAPFEPKPGLVMQAFISVPPALVRDAAKLRPWLRKAYTYVKSLPHKAKRRRPSKLQINET